MYNSRYMKHTYINMCNDIKHCYKTLPVSTIKCDPCIHCSLTCTQVGIPKKRKTLKHLTWSSWSLQIDVEEVFSSTHFANLIPAKNTKEVGFAKMFQISLFPLAHLSIFFRGFKWKKNDVKRPPKEMCTVLASASMSIFAKEVWTCEIWNHRLDSQLVSGVLSIWLLIPGFFTTFHTPLLWLHVSGWQNCHLWGHLRSN